MLKNKKSGFLLEKAEEVSLIKDFGFTDWEFSIPLNIVDSREKTIYKCGFLKEVYSLSNKEYTLKEIWSIIHHYNQVYVSFRQMERIWSRYIILSEKREES